MPDETIYFPVGWEQMTEEQQKDWARQFATLILDAAEREFGGLPPPPSDEEFHRLWDKYVTKKLNAKK
jgi:hypothetical protein